jgi:hypothetical protein
MVKNSEARSGTIIKTKIFTLLIIMKYQLILIFVLLVSCSTKQSSEFENLESLSYDKDLITTAGNNDVLIGNMAGLEVDDSNQIYIADTKLQKIHVFSSEGKFLESIGRRGKGPGEFENLNPRIKIQSDRLYVLQNNAREIDLFDINTHEHIKTINIGKIKVNKKSVGRPNALFPLEDGNMIIVFVDPYFSAPKEDDAQNLITVSIINETGNFVNKKVLQLPVPYPTNQKLIYSESGSIFVFTAPFYPDIKIIKDDRDNLIIGRSDSLEFNKFNINGELISEFSGVRVPVRFTSVNLDSIADDMGQNFRKAVNEAGIPDFWPHYESLIVDDIGRYWLKQLNPGKDVQAWQIINDQGNPKWKVNLPNSLELFVIKQNKGYGIHSPPGEVASIYRYTFNI